MNRLFNEPQPLLYISTHVLFGNLALILLGFLVITKKGTRNHVNLGRAFLGIMICILAPSFVLSYHRAYWSPDLSLKYQDLSKYFLFQNLLCAVCLWFGVRASRCRARTKPQFDFLNLMPPVLLLLFSFHLFWVGQKHHLQILWVWGILGLIVALEQIYFWTISPKTKTRWIQAHTLGMVSASLTVVTAVFVSVLPSLKVYDWSDSTLRWVAPFVAGRILFQIWSWKSL